MASAERVRVRVSYVARPLALPLLLDPSYNGKTAVVRTRCNARGRYAVTIEMRDGPETIALKVANLRIAADAA